MTALLGLGAGATWAFVGGLTVNLLTTDPLGSIPLGLLLAAAVVAGLSRLLGRAGPLVPLIGGATGSLVIDGVGILILVLLSGASPALQPGSLPALLIPTAILNGVLATMVWFVARAAMTRFGYEPTAI